jgi:hypothetical protein
MSYFDDASLVMIPSGYKNQKVYSVKPLDGSGDLTFSRASSATRVASNGLIEKVRTNVALYSEQLDNAVYSKSQTSVTANATTAPNGTTTADKLVEDTSNDIHRILQDALPYTIGNEITFSVYVKAAGRTKVELRMFDFTSNFGLVQFDLTAGTVFNTVAGAGTITSVGNGWYRCSVTAPASATSSNGLALVYLLNAAGSDTYTGDGTSGVFLWGYQVETGVATDYIATTSAAVSVGPVANVPRLDYLNSSCPRLLLEPQRTNLATYSEQANQYTKVGATIGSNVVTSPDGYTNADSIIEDGSTGGHAFYNFGITTFTAAAYTASVFAKKGGRDWFALSLYDGTQGFTAFFNLNTGVVGTITGVGTSTITNYGNGWYRCTITATTAAGSTGGIAVYSANADGTTSYAGTNGLAAGYFYGWQLELGAYATSYIPTLGTSVTRVADECLKTGISSLIGQTEGTIYAEFKCNSVANDNIYSRIISLSDGTLDNRIILIKNNTSAELYAFIGSGGSVIVNQVISGTSVLGSHKVAFAYKANNYAVYLDGALVFSSTASGTIPATSNFYLGLLETGGAGFELNGTISESLLFKTRLSNSDLATLTTL